MFWFQWEKKWCPTFTTEWTDTSLFHQLQTGCLNDLVRPLQNISFTSTNMEFRFESFPKWKYDVFSKCKALNSAAEERWRCGCSKQKAAGFSQCSSTCCIMDSALFIMHKHSSVSSPHNPAGGLLRCSEAENKNKLPENTSEQTELIICCKLSSNVLQLILFRNLYTLFWWLKSKLLFKYKL